MIKWFSLFIIMYFIHSLDPTFILKKTVIRKKNGDIKIKKLKKYLYNSNETALFWLIRNKIKLGKSKLRIKPKYMNITIIMFIFWGFYWMLNG